MELKFVLNSDNSAGKTSEQCAGDYAFSGGEGSGGEGVRYRGMQTNMSEVRGGTRCGNVATATHRFTSHLDSVNQVELHVSLVNLDLSIVISLVFIIFLIPSGDLTLKS